MKEEGQLDSTCPVWTAWITHEPYHLVKPFNQEVSIFFNIKIPFTIFQSSFFLVMLVLKLLFFWYWTPHKYILIFMCSVSFSFSLHFYSTFSTNSSTLYMKHFFQFWFLLLYTYEKSVSISYDIKKNYIWIYEHKMIIIMRVFIF